MSFLAKPEVVARSLYKLREQKTHTLFPGYLYLYRESVILGRLDDLPHDFRKFYDEFLKVGGHPVGQPYVKPFTEHKPSEKNLWLNSNVAGTYAPSSLRPDQPFRQVVLIESGTYNLRTNHVSLAKQNLLNGVKVQVAELSVFLYRDYALTIGSPTIKDFISVFAYEFGFAENEHSEVNDDFHALFSTETTGKWEGDWLTTS